MSSATRIASKRNNGCIIAGQYDTCGDKENSVRPRGVGHVT